MKWILGGSQISGDPFELLVGLVVGFPFDPHRAMTDPVCPASALVSAWCVSGAFCTPPRMKKLRPLEFCPLKCMSFSFSVPFEPPRKVLSCVSTCLP